MEKHLHTLDRILIILALLLTIIGGLGCVYVKNRDPEMFQTAITTGLGTRRSNCREGILYDKAHPNGIKKTVCDYQGTKAKMYNLADVSLLLLVWGPFAAAFFSSTLLSSGYVSNSERRIYNRSKEDLRFLSYAWGSFVVCMVPILAYVVKF